MSNMLHTISLLFLCSGNSCRGQIAEAFARTRGREDIRVSSAGMDIHPLSRRATEVMAEAGMDISSAQPKTLDSLKDLEFDLVICLSRSVAENCPVLLGNPPRVDWSLPNPGTTQGEPDAALDAFRQTRDEIARLVDDLFDHGYIDALVHAKRQTSLILNNLSEGILAHDMNRRIFYFNAAAEEITEYPREAVIGKDCNQVFPGGLCGDKCELCADNPTHHMPDTLRRSLEITTKTGAERRVDMLIKTMHDMRKRPVGVLVSFNNRTRETELAKRLGAIEQFSGIIGRDSKMQEIYELIRDVADSNVSILIQGESGTGKELVAAAIHREGARSKKLFVPINCGALPESLLESELFGHVRGAFTGAIRDKKGRFELADGGTIFLDEIGDITPAMQVKLLRVLQEGAFERVGSEITVQVDVRVISATNKDLMSEVRAGRFREDLYYRLSVMPIELPPLRDRRTDIPLLAKHILKRFLEESHRQKPEAKPLTLSPESIDTMLSYDWPGNVRELQNWIQFALVKCKGTVVLPEHLPPHDSTLANGKRLAPPPLRLSPAGGFGKRRKRKLSFESVEQALSKTNGNKLAAARELGVARATLYRFLDEQEA